MSHQARAEAAADLAGRLAGARVVMDPAPGDSPSPLKTSIHAWEAVAPGATHHLVLQDDVVPTEQLLDRVRSGIELFPDAALSLYANWNSRNAAAVRLAAAAGATWMEELGGEYYSTLGVVLPASRIADYVAFARTYTKWWGEDDEMMREFLVTRGIEAYAAVPCLVEHGALESSSGNQWHGLRQAPCFLPGPAHDSSYEALAHGIDFVPWMSRNRAQVLVRVDYRGRQEWVNRPWTDLVEPFQLDVAAMHDAYLRAVTAGPRLLAARAELSDVFTEALWTTAYAMGTVQRGDRVPVKLLSGEAVRPGPESLVRAGLRTLAAGGAGWTHLPMALLMSYADETTELAEDGYRAGLAGS
ncbi:hypothetical protein ACWKSP_05865 [Micromonosporaceae bacterium Da 78-11]